MAARRRPGGGLIGGKPDLGGEGVAVPAHALALNGGTHEAGGGIHLQRAGENGQVLVHRDAGNVFLSVAEHQARGPVGAEGAAGAVEGEDRGRARFGEHPQVLFDFPAQRLLAFDFGDVIEHEAAVLHQLEDEESGGAVGDYGKEEANGGIERALGHSEIGSQKRAGKGGQQDGVAFEHHGAEHKRHDVEDAERDVEA